MDDASILRGTLRRARDASRVRSEMRRVREREQLRFRAAFAEFWVGDDDCWEAGHTDSLADAAFLAMLREDVDGAVAAVVRRAERGLGLRLGRASRVRLREFLLAYGSPAVLGGPELLSA